jgi:hypothetical protein
MALAATDPPTMMAAAAASAKRGLILMTSPRVLPERVQILCTRTIRQKLIKTYRVRNTRFVRKCNAWQQIKDARVPR